MSIHQISIYTFSLLTIITLLVHISRKENRYLGSYKYFRAVVFATAVFTLLEFLSWTFDGQTGGLAIQMNRLFNHLLYYFSAVPITLWFVYFDYHIFYSEKRLRRKKEFYIFVNGIIFVMTSINIFVPYLFTFNVKNQFVGLNGSLIVAGTQLLFLLYYLGSTINIRNKVTSKIFRCIILLSVLPFISSIIQSLIKDSIFVMPSLIYICIYAFLLIEREEMMKDPLTNLSLRKHLESRMTYLMKLNVPFTLILIDLDKFKRINDEFGHNKGDEVLIAFADMLLNSIHKVDSVYRYAGDEFVILFESQDMIILDSIMSKLKIQLKEFNKFSMLGEHLSFSYGLVRVFPEENKSISEIISEVDAGMYENKRKKQ